MKYMLLSLDTKSIALNSVVLVGVHTSTRYHTFGAHARTGGVFSLCASMQSFTPDTSSRTTSFVQEKITRISPCESKLDFCERISTYLYPASTFRKRWTIYRGDHLLFQSLYVLIQTPIMNIFATPVIASSEYVAKQFLWSSPPSAHRFRRSSRLFRRCGTEETGCTMRKQQQENRAESDPKL